MAGLHNVMLEAPQHSQWVIRRAVLHDYDCNDDNNDDDDENDDDDDDVHLPSPIAERG